MSTLVKRRTAYLLILILMIVIGYFLLPISLPIIIAFVTALFLEPIVQLFNQKFKQKRQFSVMIVFILFLCFISASSYFLATKVITEAIKIAQNTPYYLNDINQAWLRIEMRMTMASKNLPVEVVSEISKNIESFLTNMKLELTKRLNFQNVKNLITSLPNFLVNFLVYLISLYLFLIDIPSIKRRFYNHLTDKTADKVTFMYSRLSYVIFGFFKAQFFVSIIIFIVSLIGLIFISPDVALLMSVIIWVIDFIPIIGSIVILGPWSLFQFITGDVVLGTKLAILAGILLVIRRTVEPKVMGQQIGLSPLSTLIAMFLGLKLLGILGFIVGPVLLIAFNSAREAGIIKMNFKL